MEEITSTSRRRNSKKSSGNHTPLSSTTPTTTPDTTGLRQIISFPSPLSPAQQLPLSIPSTSNTPTSPTNKAPVHGITSTATRTANITTTADLGQHILFGLSFAGVAVCCFSTIFELFHVDVFLRAYELPNSTYSVGRILFSIASTASSLWGAWWVDSQVASTQLQRFELVGFSGLLLSIAFILPFGRFWTWHDNAWYWHLLDGLHFVVSMSIYDGLSTIVQILLASAVSDDHNMTDYERIQNAVGSQVWNLLASLVVANVGVNLFDVSSLKQFQYFVIVVAVLSILVFGASQSIISGYHQQHPARNSKTRMVWYIWKGWTVRMPHDGVWDHGASSKNSTSAVRPKKAVVWRQAVHDLWSNANFRRWIFLEMLLEMQTHFTQTFFKTFVDQLLVNVPGAAKDWLLSLLRPTHQVMAIICYIPIRWYGYARVYTMMLILMFCLSSITILSATPGSSTGWISLFLMVYAVSSEAVRAAGYYMVVSDLVLELKQRHAQQGRLDEPSLAGILLGATTLACKPVQSILPIVAANLLHYYPLQRHKVLYYLLVFPPWICSLLQLYVWQHYDLHPKRTQEMRVELQYLKQQHRQTDGSGPMFSSWDGNIKNQQGYQRLPTNTKRTTHKRRQRQAGNRQRTENSTTNGIGHLMSV